MERFDHLAARRLQTCSLQSSIVMPQQEIELTVKLDVAPKLTTMNCLGGFRTSVIGPMLV